MPIDHLNNTRPEKVEKPHGAKGRIYRATLWTVNSGSGDVDTGWVGNADVQVR